MIKCVFFCISFDHQHHYHMCATTWTTLGSLFRFRPGLASPTEVREHTRRQKVFFEESGQPTAGAALLNVKQT